MTKFKAFIRVVKSITEYNFASEDIIREPLSRLRIKKKWKTKQNYFKLCQIEY